MAEHIRAGVGRLSAVFLGRSARTHAATGNPLWLADGILRSSDRLSLVGLHDQRVRRLSLPNQRFGFLALCRAASDSNDDLCAARAQRRVWAFANFPSAVLGTPGIFVSAAFSLAHRQLASVLHLVHSNRGPGRSLRCELRHRLVQRGRVKTGNRQERRAVGEFAAVRLCRVERSRFIGLWRPATGKYFRRNGRGAKNLGGVGARERRYRYEMEPGTGTEKPRQASRVDGAIESGCAGDLAGVVH